MEWTSSAEAELERRLSRAAGSLEAEGVDPAEVAADVRHHVETELQALGATVVTADQAEHQLRQMGFHEEDAPVRDDAPTPTPRRERAPAPKFPKVAVILGGILLPSAALFVELNSGICAEHFFDPLPTVAHALFFGSIVAASCLLLVCSDGAPTFTRRLTAGVVGFALVAAIVYCIAFLPMAPLSCIAVLVGFGLLSLSPFFALGSLLTGLSWLRKSEDETTESLRRALGIGAGLALLFVLLLEAPPLLTQRGLALAVDADAATRERGVSLLRNWGDEDEILTVCYEPTRFRSGFLGDRRTETNSLLGAFGIPRTRVTRQQARELYYRVTGRPFNSVPPPTRVQRAALGDASRWRPRTNWEEQGGDVVAGRIPGLELAASRLDGIVDAQAALAYIEWTMEFTNHSPASVEARAELALPPGGTVSRLTLWVNGVEREAVFGARDRVTKAYKDIVNRPRATRDPVLVRTSGPDRILVQCFPVLPGGTPMKIRMGITAPLAPDGLDGGWVGTPSIVERNFDLPEEAIHALWWESHADIEAGSEALVAEHPTEDVYAVRGTLTDEHLGQGRGAVRIAPVQPAPTTWTPDPTDPEGFAIVQRITTPSSSGATAPPALALAIDGSRLMEDALEPVARFVEKLPAGMRLDVYVAREELAEALATNVTTGPDTSHDVAERIRDVDTRGGCDGVPALLDALLAAGSGPGGVVLWVHGPQPVTLRSTSALGQYFDRRPNGARILALQAVRGPNRLLDVLDLYPGARAVGRRGSLDADLDRLLASWGLDAPRWVVERQRVPLQDLDPSTRGKKTSRNLAKLWARDAVDERLRRRARQDAKMAQKIATAHRIVVPVTAAVVLETDDQYVQAGLEPPSEEAVEDDLMEMAEPELWVLAIVVALLLLLGHRARARQQGNATPAI